MWGPDDSLMSGTLAEPAPFPAFGGEITGACENCTPSFVTLSSPVSNLFTICGKLNSIQCGILACAVDTAFPLDLQLFLWLNLAL